MEVLQKVPAKKLQGKVVQLLKAEGRDFVSADTAELPLTLEGIQGDFHHGISRKSGGREPWYPRGTVMRNERQVSLLSIEDIEDIRSGMGLDKLDAGWIGANLVVQGIPNFSYLPSRTLMFFEGGVTLRIDGYNSPCRLAGGSIAENVGVSAPDNDFSKTDMALAFKEAAHMKRGVVAWVEKAGTIKPGEKFTIRIWEQWIY